MIHQNVISFGRTRQALAAATILLGLLTLTAGSALSDSLAYDIGSNGTFGTLDLATGALTQTGNTGITPAGLGEIGSTLFTADYEGTGLYTVNTLTGAITPISSLGLNGIGFNTLGSTATGLYALDNSFNLYSINPATGVATLIGATGAALGVVSGSYGFSLSTGSSTLYFEDDYDLYSINTTTGQGTLMGQSGAPGIGFNSLVSENGTLYGVESSTTLPYNTLYTIDTSTGVGTLGETLNPDVAVASWGMAPAFAVPEPTPLALLALGFGFLSVGASRFRGTRLTLLMVVARTTSAFTSKAQTCTYEVRPPSSEGSLKPPSADCVRLANASRTVNAQAAAIQQSASAPSPECGVLGFALKRDVGLTTNPEPAPALLALSVSVFAFLRSRFRVSLHTCSAASQAVCVRTPMAALSVILLLLTQSANAQVCTCRGGGLGILKPPDEVRPTLVSEIRTNSFVAIRKTPPRSGKAAELVNISEPDRTSQTDSSENQRCGGLYNINPNPIYPKLGNVRVPTISAHWAPPGGLSNAEMQSRCPNGFNWQQWITSLPCPSAIFALTYPTNHCDVLLGGGLTAGVPPVNGPLFNDPPPGGLYFANPTAYPSLQPLTFPSGAVYNPAPYYYDIKYATTPDLLIGLLSDGNDHDPLGNSAGATFPVNFQNNVLFFSDHPSDPCLPTPPDPTPVSFCGNSFAPVGSYVQFRTALVGILSDKTPSLPLFEWTWTTTYNGKFGDVVVRSINGQLFPDPVSPSDFSAVTSGLAYSRVTQTFDGVVLITNTSSSQIAGPLQVVLFGLSDNVTLANETGDYSGTPYITLSYPLSPQQSVSVTVAFKNPSNGAITFTPAVYSGSMN